MYWSLFISACACFAASVPLYLRLPKAGPEPSFLEGAGALKSFAIGGLEIPSHYLAGASIVLCCLYAALSLGFILSSFRKTASTEVFFFSLWVLSVAFEVLRLGAFAIAVGGGTAFVQAAEARALLFTRYAGSLALFASGLYAVGFRNEKLGTVVGVVLIISLGLALAMPINTGSYAPTLELRSGYSALSEALLGIVAAVTIFNFFYASTYKGERTYRVIALGALALVAGHKLMTSQWNPLLLLAGFALLAAGTWLFVSRLHTYYLWQ